jgi:methylmalonyl-CoA mutase
LTDEVDHIGNKNVKAIARMISAAENFPEESKADMVTVHAMAEKTGTPVLGITGTGGAGKSSLVDELVRRFLIDFPEKEIAIVSVDPSKRKTGGALLGDRIRMNSIRSERVYMRSLATRQSNLALSKHVAEALQVLKAANYDLIILETSGIGQSDTEIMDHSDVSLYVMTPEFGAATQLEKIDMLDFADVIALNKFDKRGALDAIRDVKKQYMRNNELWDTPMDQMPVYGTIASQFNDPGMNSLYKVIMDTLVERTGVDLPSTFEVTAEMSEKIFVIPPKRNRYLSEISESNRAYDEWVDKQVALADKLCAIERTIATLADEPEVVKVLQAQFDKMKLDFDPKNMLIIENWNDKVQKYKEPVFKFKVRNRELSIETHSTSLSQLQIPKVALPKYTGWGDVLRWSLQENVPGEFPYTAGLFPFKREGEDPTRMFAGEG